VTLGQADAESDPPSTTGAQLEVRPRPYDHPDATRLIAEAQEFYVSLYGGPDETPLAPEEFAPPVGRFLVGYWAGKPVATGGWRFSDAGVPTGARRPAEIKRMFVRESARHRGHARQMLAALEADAAAAGADWMILETAHAQVAAVALYRSSGYTEIEPFGYYAGSDGVLNLGRPLTTG
jgi:ribosomal protein S18 acetylase RimI-like enzyme